MTGSDLMKCDDRISEKRYNDFMKSEAGGNIHELDAKRGRPYGDGNHHHHPDRMLLSVLPEILHFRSDGWCCKRLIDHLHYGSHTEAKGFS